MPALLTAASTMMCPHGGTVTATSEGRGRGAQFRICLPMLMVPREVQELGAAS